MKKIISLLLSLTLLISLTAGLDFSAYAEGVDDFTYEAFDEGTVLITGYTGTEETVYVPNTIYGNKVLGIANYAFFGCENLKSITISSEIEAVGEYAFSQCTNLTDVNLGTGMLEIGSYAFEGCYSLKRIAVSDVLAVVGEGAFNGCYAVTDIYFPGTEELWGYVPIEDYYPYSLDNINVHYNSDEIHDYELVETVDPTCTVAGYEKYQCPCGYVRTVEIPETGHNYVNGECTNCEILPEILNLGETKNVSISQAGTCKYFSFVPERDGKYRLYSTGDFDTYGYVYDESWNNISSDDDGGIGNNFSVIYDFKARKTYYFCVKLFDSSIVGDFKVALEEITISSIEYIPVNDVEYIENSNGRFDYNENNEEFYYYEIPYFTIGDILKVTDKDGSVAEYTFIGWQEDDGFESFESQDGVRIYADDIRRYDNQYVDHWELGSDNYYTVEYFGISCSVPVTISENPYSEIIYTPKNGGYTIYEGVNCREETDYNGEIFYYYDLNFELGDKITLITKNGERIDYVYPESTWGSSGSFISADFENENGEIVQVSINIEQYETHWTVGNVYELTVECNGLTTTTNVSIVENPISSIDFIPVNPVEYTENTNGRYEYDENGQQYYQYNLRWFEIGDILRVYLKDDSVVDYEYRGWDSSAGYSCFASATGDYISEQDVLTEETQYYDHWQVGKDNSFRVKYLGKYCDVPVTIKQNLVNSIEYMPINPKEYVENTNGRYENSNEGDYFRYYIPSFENGDILKVTENDGKVTVYTYIGMQDDGELYFVSQDGVGLNVNEISYYDNQYENHWTLGSDNYYTIEYSGVTCDVPVTITESPILSIEYIPVNPVEYIEHSDGYYEYDDSGEKYFYYNLPPYDIGDVLKVTEKNGEVTEYTYIGWQDDGEEYFESSDAKRINVGDLLIIDQQYEQHWTLGANNYYTINYIGASCDVPVSVIENPIASIEFIPVNPVNYTENIGGYFEYDDYGEKYFFYSLPSFEIGDTLRINNKDGSVIDYTYKGWQEQFDEYVFVSKNGDYILEGDVSQFSNQYEEHWTLGNENYYQIKYLGILCDVPVIINENNIKSIEYIKADCNIVEYTNGYRETFYDNDGILRDYYKYILDCNVGDILRVVTNDNTVNEYICTEKEKEYEDGTISKYLEFCDENGNSIDVENISISYSQSYDNYWTAGNSYPVQVTYGGQNSVFEVNIVEHMHNFSNGFCTYCYALEDGYDLPVAKTGKNSVIIDEAGETVLFSYTPKTNGTVNIYSAGSYDTVGYLYDSNMKLVAYNDDNDSGNFGFDYYMQANETYYIACRIYSADVSGDFTLNINPQDGVDVEVLEYVIELVNALSPEDYLQQSYDALIALLDTIPEDLSSLSQSEIDAYATMLLEGMYNLVAYLNLSLSAENGAYTVTVNDSQSSNSSYSVLYGDSVTVNAQANDGYKFVGWYDTVSGIYKSNNAEYTFKMTANTSLKAVFVQEDSATLTFTTYSNWIEKEITNTVTQWNEITSIEELLPDVPYRYGYSNGRWVYDNDEVLAKLRAGENVSIVAEYDTDDTSLPTPPLPDGDIPVLDLYYKLDADENIGSFVMAAGLPENCKVESIGIAFYYDNANRFDPTRFDLLINNKTFESSFSTEELEDTYIVNVERFTSKDNWAARGYVTYYDSEGNLKTVYSDQINIVKREQV